MNRKEFIFKSSQALAILPFLGSSLACSQTNNDLFFKISLAQWSIHKALFDGSIDHLDFAKIARKFDCEGLEYVTNFFSDKAKNISYLNKMNNAAKNQGVENVLIMVSKEGYLASPKLDIRKKGIENHYKWIDAAHHLGCHAIRVDLRGGKIADEATKASLDSLNALSDYAKGSNINVLVENHGGFTSNGNWMYQLFSQIEKSNCGTLPDFGNFCIKRDKKQNCIDEYNKYKGLSETLPFAKAVSAKSRRFDSIGNEIETDYLRALKMVKEVGYTGYIGIEFEGNEVSEFKGIELTRNLLTKIGKQIS